MKATLEFNLPDDHEEFQNAQHGAKWNAIVYSMNEQLRTWQKHGHTFGSAEDALNQIRERLLLEISNEGLSL